MKDGRSRQLILTSVFRLLYSGFCILLSVYFLPPNSPFNRPPAVLPALFTSPLTTPLRSGWKTGSAQVPSTGLQGRPKPVGGDSGSGDLENSFLSWEFTTRRLA